MRAPTSRLARLGPARLGAVVFAAVLAAGLLPATVAGFVAGGPQPNDRTATDQVVVRWTDGSAGTAFGAQADAPSVGARPDRVSAVSQATGLPATWQRTLAVGGDVYKLTSTLTPDAMASAMAALRVHAGRRHRGAGRDRARDRERAERPVLLRELPVRRRRRPVGPVRRRELRHVRHRPAGGVGPHEGRRRHASPSSTRASRSTPTSAT